MNLPPIDLTADFPPLSSVLADTTILRLERDKLTWKQVLGGSSCESLVFCPPVTIDGKRLVAPSLEILQDGAKTWNSILVGFFLGKRPPFPVVHAWANKIWKTRGLLEVLLNEEDLILFKFDTEARAKEILEAGPWHIRNFPIFLQFWKPEMSLERVKYEQIPIWVNFHNVPLEYWSTKRLSHLVSYIGKPICMDENTASKKRIGYARLCINIEYGSTLLDSIPLLRLGENDELFKDTIKVSYQWRPTHSKKKEWKEIGKRFLRGDYEELMGNKVPMPEGLHRDEGQNN